MNKLESKPKPKIISTEVQNEALMFSINKAIKELKVEFSIDDLEEEKLGDVFRHVYNSIMPLHCKEAGYIFNRDENIEGLTNKALEFVEEAKFKLFGIAFLELLFLAVSASSEKFLKDKGESDRITTRFLTFSQQLDWLDDKKRKILRSFLKLHGSGGNIASQYPWNYETCIAFVNMVDRVKPLWEFILDFYKSRKASTNRLALLKKEDTFQTLSNSYTLELIEKVITKMLNQFISSNKTSKRRLSTPLAFACDHAAYELNINRQDKPYSKETLIRYYQEIKREEFERLNDTMITERFLTLINLLQKQS